MMWRADFKSPVVEYSYHMVLSVAVNPKNAHVVVCSVSSLKCQIMGCFTVILEPKTQVGEVWSTASKSFIWCDFTG